MNARIIIISIAIYSLSGLAMAQDHDASISDGSRYRFLISANDPLQSQRNIISFTPIGLGMNFGNQGGDFYLPVNLQLEYTRLTRDRKGALITSGFFAPVSVANIFTENRERIPRVTMEAIYEHSFNDQVGQGKRMPGKEAALSSGTSEITRLKLLTPILRQFSGRAGIMYFQRNHLGSEIRPPDAIPGAEYHISATRGTAISAGISMKSTHHFKVKDTNSGRGGSYFRYVNTYMDLLYTPFYLAIGNRLTSFTYNWGQLEEFKTLPQTLYGYRLGISIKQKAGIMRNTGISAGAEAGKTPGLKSGSHYILLKLGFAWAS
jgi:hypothetical protein